MNLSGNRSRSGYFFIFNEPVAYQEALDLQETLHCARCEDRIADTVLVMQHQPVITLGRRGRTNYLQVPAAELSRRGIELYTASRGGDVTYHGPGQWVVYPILRLDALASGARGYLWSLEETALRTAADFGVISFRREGMSGAWTDTGKISAIGFHVRRGVTLHGMSFNVRHALVGFEYIVPCGLEGQSVAGLEAELGASCPAMSEVAERLIENFSSVTGLELQRSSKLPL